MRLEQRRQLYFRMFQEQKLAFLNIIFQVVLSYAFGATGRTYGTLILTGSAQAATYTASGGSALTIKGNFIINSGVTYTSSMSAAMNVAGNFTHNGTALTIPVGQTVNFNGTSAQNISGTNNITLLGAVNITNNAGVFINSNIGVTVGGTLTNSAGASGLVIELRWFAYYQQ